jgi:hypothetical protein
MWPYETIFQYQFFNKESRKQLQKFSVGSNHKDKQFHLLPDMFVKRFTKQIGDSIQRINNECLVRNILREIEYIVSAERHFWNLSRIIKVYHYWGKRTLLMQTMACYYSHVSFRDNGFSRPYKKLFFPLSECHSFLKINIFCSWQARVNSKWIVEQSIEDCQNKLWISSNGLDVKSMKWTIFLSHLYWNN